MKKGILIVAGHGGSPYDPGATGNGKKEAELTRQFASELYNQYKKYGVDVALYDKNYDMYKETQKGHGAYTNQGYTNVVEVHFNAASADAHGTEVLLVSGGKPDSIDNGFLDGLNNHFTNRGFKYRSDLLNMNVYATSACSYRLIEVCFISNKADMDHYNANYKNIALDIVLKTYVDLGGSKPVTDKPKYYFEVAAARDKADVDTYKCDALRDKTGEIRYHLRCLNDTYIYEDNQMNKYITTCNTFGANQADVVASLGAVNTVTKDGYKYLVHKIKWGKEYAYVAYKKYK